MGESGKWRGGTVSLMTWTRSCCGSTGGTVQSASLSCLQRSPCPRLACTLPIDGRISGHVSMSQKLRKIGILTAACFLSRAEVGRHAVTGSPRVEEAEPRGLHPGAGLAGGAGVEVRRAPYLPGASPSPRRAPGVKQGPSGRGWGRAEKQGHLI